MRRAKSIATISSIFLLLWPSLTGGQTRKPVAYNAEKAIAAPPAPVPSAPPLAINDILLKMSDRVARRDGLFSGYTVNRTYEMVSDDKKPPYVVQSQMTFDSSSRTKTFKLLSKSGTGGTVSNMVYDHAVDAEKASMSVSAGKQAAITAENYDFVLQGREQSGGVDCYVLELKPKRIDKMLLKGRVWVTTTDCDVVRVEGATAKSPSMWIKKVYLARQFQQIDGLWWPKQEDWTVDVRLYGQLKVKIMHQDYKMSK